ncbi:hypothetical protein D3C72_1580410 [compost metagenome]
MLRTLPVVQAIGSAVVGGGQVGAGEHPRQFGGGNPRAGQFIAVLDHIGIRNILLAGAHLDPHGEVVHQRLQLLQQVVAERLGVGDGDAVGAGHLDLGIGAHGGRRLALALIGQTQFRVVELTQLLGVRLDAFLDIALERPTQGAGGLPMEGGQAIHGLFGSSGDDEVF